MDHEPLELLRHALDLRRAGRSVHGCLVVKARGSTPQTAGALMLVDDAAGMRGTVGGGCVEAEVRRRALGMLAEGRSGLLAFRLDHDYGWDDGLICGGTIHLAVGPMPGADELASILADADARRPTSLPIVVEDHDPGDADLDGVADGTAGGPLVYRLHLRPAEPLVIAGAGHVGQALARQGVRLGFEVLLVDDRPDLLEHVAAAVPGVRTITGPIAATLAGHPIDERTSAVVVTRGHRHDEAALEAVVDRGARYVGMIGSRRKVKLITDDLLERGVDPAALAAVHAPIGLPIGAVTVEEIAVSIAAQLVEVRRREAVPVVEGPPPTVRATAAAE